MPRPNLIGNSSEAL